MDQFTRKARLSALCQELATDETHQVQHEIDEYLGRHRVSADEDTPERAVLAKRLMRAEIEALKRAAEHDRGDYSGQPPPPSRRNLQSTATESGLYRRAVREALSSWENSGCRCGIAKCASSAAWPIQFS